MEFTLVMQVPFLHPSWLGVALVAAVVVAVVAPPRLRLWWVMAGVGVLTATGLALCQVIPWTGHLQLSAYGIFLFLAFAVGYVAMVARASTIGVSERHISNLTMIALIAGMIGSRVFEIMDHWESFTVAHGQPIPWDQRLTRMADIDGGGMVWYGGALLGAVSVSVYAWRQRLQVLSLSDIVMPALVAGLGIGRIGCFFNGCCFGLPTELPWAVMAKPGPCLRHPTQLYEVLACSILFALCWWWWRRRRWDGQVTIVACIGYATWRFINEVLREDKVMTHFWGLFPVSTAQVISIYLVAATLTMALLVRAYRLRHPDAASRARLVPGSVHAQVSLPAERQS